MSTVLKSYRFPANLIKGIEKESKRRGLDESKTVRKLLEERLATLDQEAVTAKAKAEERPPTDWEVLFPRFATMRVNGRSLLGITIKLKLPPEKSMIFENHFLSLITHDELRHSRLMARYLDMGLTIPQALERVDSQITSLNQKVTGLEAEVAKAKQENQSLDLMVNYYKAKAERLNGQVVEMTSLIQCKRYDEAFSLGYKAALYEFMKGMSRSNGQDLLRIAFLRDYVSDLHFIEELAKIAQVPEASNCLLRLKQTARSLQFLREKYGLSDEAVEEADRVGRIEVSS